MFLDRTKNGPTISDYEAIWIQLDEIRRFPVFDYVDYTDYETPYPLARTSYTPRGPRAGPGARSRVMAASTPRSGRVDVRN